MIGNKLEPFKFWCQKVLPNVYDDSLSYYEYLCKLNEYLNEVIEQINTLTDNMEDYEADLTATWLETKEYIDNYFNNLNVQQEINNKLDAMAESGELSTLLAPIVGTQIGGVVADQIGATVASQIGATVASQIDESVAGQIATPTANATTSWLSQHVDPVGSAVIVDNSLTISGAAADASITGQYININALNIAKDNFTNPVNLIDVSKLKNGVYIDGSTGGEVVGTSSSGLNTCTNDFVPVLSSTKYYVTPLYTSFNVVYYDATKSLISAEISNTNFTTPSNCSYVKLSFKQSEIIDTLSISRIESANKYIALTDRVYNKKPYIDTDCMIVASKVVETPYQLITSNTRCTTGLIWLEDIRVRYNAPNKMALYLYDENLQFITVYGFTYFDTHDYVDITDGKYVIFVFAFADSSTISQSDFATLSATPTFERVNYNDIDKINNVVKAVSEKTEWRNGSCNNTFNQDGISFKYIQPNMFASQVTLMVNNALDTGHKYRFQITTYTVDSGKPEVNTNNRVTIENTFVTSENFYSFSLTDNSIGFAFALYELDENNDYVPLRVNTFNTDNIYILRNYDINMFDMPYYSIGSDFSKKQLNMTKLGSLTGEQSFCIYNNKYYSTDGSHLYEQDSTFTLLSTSDLNLGHGNSLQLGHSNKAYVSGWDDQKVYEVDLSTKAITDTIVLPTTGYTTVAVDDVNKLMYIFQRDSLPSTEAYYNFIVYDYDNENVISTKKITKAFGAMQACDFIDGLIVVLNGLGTNAVPNGYRVFNTNGDIINEFVFTPFINSEPEGVFVDRDTKSMKISFATKEVYVVE